jgi:hypothetical protein
MALPEVDPTILSGNFIAIGVEGTIDPTGLSGLGLAVLAKGKVEMFSKMISQTSSNSEKSLFYAEVDELAYHWLLPRGGLLGEGKLIPVGFNVASQGMQTFLDNYPKTKSLFSVQVIDLNSICLTLEGLTNSSGKIKKFNGWRKEALKETKKVLLTLGFKLDKNDMAFGAAQGLLSWVWFRGVFNNKLEMSIKKVKEPSSKEGS